MAKLNMLVLFAFLSVQIKAQCDTSELKLRYHKDVIYLTVPGYMKNNTRYRKWHLNTEFGFSSEGAKIFKLHQEDALKSFLYVSLGFIVFGATAVADNHGYNKLAEVLSYCALVPIGVSIPFAFRSNKRMKRAIWLRNRDVLLN